MPIKGLGSEANPADSVFYGLCPNNPIDIRNCGGSGISIQWATEDRPLNERWATLVKNETFGFEWQ